MVYAQTRICLEERDIHNSLKSSNTNGSPNLSAKTFHLTNIPADDKIKVKESEKQDKYLDFTWKLK